MAPITLSGYEEWEKLLLNFLNNPGPPICGYILYYSHVRGNSLSISFECPQLKDMDAVKEFGMRILRETNWHRKGEIEGYRFLKYEETIIKWKGDLKIKRLL